ncbi:hypothetical protein BGZ60DRAFT_405496 [Tricladium varicosporioides]|nr:hypothetical protein BGZ60DRAFT_405496 [Hymenoscyphus varicosporioides]
MPLISLQQSRLKICMFAALSITILLLTVVHLRHFMPRRGHGIGNRVVGIGMGEKCNSFFASELVGCKGVPDELGDVGGTRGKERLRQWKEEWL